MAGHYAAMSEFLLRGYNTALPVVDRGDDLLTLEDERGEVRRVQVKTRTLETCKRTPCLGCGICRGGLWVIRPRISRRQLRELKETDLYFMFMLRPDDAWRFVLLSQAALVRIYDAAREVRRLKDHESAGDDLMVPIEIDPGKSTAQIWGQTIAEYSDPWREWPLTRFSRAPSDR